jgi:DNA-binding response OmpR family regulator
MNLRRASMHSILIADNEIPMCETIGRELAEAGFSVASVHNGKEAVDYLTDNQTDLILLELVIPVMNGFQVMREIKKRGIKTKIIVFTIKTDLRSAIESAKKGARFYIPKPYDFNDVLTHIKRVLSEDGRKQNN